MPKVAKSNDAKVRDFARQYPHEFSATPTAKLWCDLCEVEVKYDKTFHVESHRKTQKHKHSLEQQQTCPLKLKQTFLGSQTPFNELVVFSFLAADIPLKKLSHPAIQRLFSEAGKTLPSESAARHSVSILAEREIDRLKNILVGKKNFLIVDEAEVSGGKFLNTLVGDLENPSVTFLAQCKAIDGNANSEMVARTADDVLRLLCVERKNFALLVTDAAKYMISAGESLKTFYPWLKHVTCVAHLLHNCAMRIRAHFSSIDSLIACVKAATLKNKDRRSMFRSAGLSSPPEPILTRWGTWLRASFFYAENLPAIIDIIGSWESSGVLVTRAKEAIRSDRLVTDLVTIQQYRPLVALLERVEDSSYSIQQAYDDLQSLRFDDDPCAVRSYIDQRIQRKTDLVTIVEARDPSVSPHTYYLLKQAQATSAAVERSFSMLKKLLRKDRNFLPENVQKYLLPFYNHRKAQ